MRLNLDCQFLYVKQKSLWKNETPYNESDGSEGRYVNFCDILVYIHVNVYIYYNSWEYASKIHWIIIYKLKNLVSEQT